MGASALSHPFREPPSDPAASTATNGGFLSHLLTAKAAPLCIAVLAVALATPALATGFAADDFFHRILLLGIPIPGVHGRPLDLFFFSSPELAWAQQDIGMRGWWADPELRVAFFRPISALTHALDYLLWPDSPWAMHAHSLALYAASLFVVAKVYRRFIADARTLTIAFLFFAIDDAHGFALSWIANRNAIVAFGLGMVVLLLHDSARRRRQRWAAALAPFSLAVALLGGEAGLAVLGYLASYALFLDGGTRRERLLTLAPYAAVVVAWRFVYGLLGYGTSGSGLVVDPVEEPLKFAGALVDHIPVLLAAQLAAPPAELLELYPAVAPWLPALMRALMLAVTATIGWLVWPILRRERSARFFALGAALSLIPFCATAPHDRLLFASGVGAMAVLARFVVSAARKSRAVLTSPSRKALQRPALVGLVLVHAVWPLYALPLRAQGPAHAARILGKGDATIPDTPAVEQQSVILMNPPAGDAFGGYLPMQRAAMGRHRPGHLRWLATGVSDVTVERLDARKLRVRMADGFLSVKWEWMQRSPSRPMPVGYTVRLSDLTLVVTRQTADARPAEIEVEFKEPLESSKLVFLEWTPEGFAPFHLPEVGARVTLPRIDFSVIANSLSGEDEPHEPI